MAASRRGCPAHSMQSGTACSSYAVGFLGARSLPPVRGTHANLGRSRLYRQVCSRYDERRQAKAGRGPCRPGVPKALRRWRDWPGAPRDVVFRAAAVDRHADYFRDDLRTADVSRKELFVSGPGQQPTHVHDLRAMAIALWLAAGKNEKYCTDRCGHARRRC